MMNTRRGGSKKLPLDRPCCDCGETNPDKFLLAGKKKIRLRRCRSCQYKYKVAWQKANPEKHRAIVKKNNYKPEKLVPLEIKRKNYKYVYGITLEEGAAIIAKEQGICPICKEQKTLVIDHCHKSKMIRRAICSTCNSMLGHAYDSPDILRSGAKYLESFSPIREG